MPNFPIRSEATYLKWSSILDEYKFAFNPETVIIAHSIGNPFIINYLSHNKLNAKLYISVAGFCNLFTVPDREDLNDAFINFSITDETIMYCKQNVPNRFSLYSDTDHIIPFNILKSFTFKIESLPIFIKGMGHFGNRDNITRIFQIEDIINKLATFSRP